MRNRKGFTLIEVLVVATILGILASLAIPRFLYLKQRALVASMISDLHNLVATQEAYYSVYGGYAGGITAGPETPGASGAGRASFLPSPGVQIVVTFHGSGGAAGEGWSAVATHPTVTDPTRDECGVFVGDLSFSPDVHVTQPGQVACY